MAAPRTETGKQRAVRIPLDYYKKADGLSRWKLWLTALALIVGVGWWVSGMFGSDGGNLRYSRGPVASVHATWEQNCEACHVPFRPVGGKGNWFGSSLFGSAKTTDLQCQQCHSGAVHHETAKEESTASCAGCHHDHQGRDFSLVKLADGNCTSCHANLAANTKGTPRWEAKVTAFAAGSHPEFTQVKTKGSDPGKLKFNHKLHLTPGQADVRWTLGDIKDRGQREYYRGLQPEDQRKDTDLVVLSCASCHAADGGDLGAKQGNPLAGVQLPARGDGRYMMPITYENQCSACHPLNLEPKDDKNPAAVVSVPHGLQLDGMRDYLWGAYASREVKAANPDAAKELLQPRAMPGKAGGPEEKQIRDRIKQNVAAAEGFLALDKAQQAQRLALGGKTTCGECHYYDKGDDNTFKSITATQVPQVWQQHAVFNHARHRALDCRECHANAYAFQADGKTPNTAASADHKDVLLPSIETCVKCHAPASRGRGGARADCTECHRYHNGDQALQGMGALKRGPHNDKMAPKPMTIDQFLTGRNP